MTLYSKTMSSSKDAISEMVMHVLSNNTLLVVRLVSCCKHKYKCRMSKDSRKTFTFFGQLMTARREKEKKL